MTVSRPLTAFITGGGRGIGKRICDDGGFIAGETVVIDGGRLMR